MDNASSINIIIAKTIIKNRSKIIEALQEEGYCINENISDNALVEKIIKVGQENSRFKGYFSRLADKFRNIEPTIIGAIGTAVSSFFGWLKKSSDKRQAEQQAVGNIQAEILKLKQQEEKNKKIAIIGVISLATITTIIIAYIYINSKNK